MKKLLYITIAATILKCFLLNYSHALNIPLGKSDGKSTAVGYVDMELIFQEFPETKKAKQEYYAEVEKRRKALSDQEAEIERINQRLVVLKTTLEDLLVATSTSTAVDSSTDTVHFQESESLETELAKKKDELEISRKKAVKELEKLEENRSLQILGRIYNILKDLAQEEGISMVVDKTSILYGSEAVDLTYKLRNRLRGR